MSDSNDDGHTLGGLSNIDQPVAPTERAPPMPSPPPMAPAAPPPPNTPPVVTSPPVAPAQSPLKPRDPEPAPVPAVPVRSETPLVVPARRTLPQFRIPELSGFRAPKSFRIDTTLLSYIARHELYRQALHDKRGFTDKLNDWIKQKMEEEDRILQFAEADVRGIEAELMVNEQPVASAVTAVPETAVALTAPIASTGELGDEVETQPETVAASPGQDTLTRTPPIPKTPSMAELQRVMKSGRNRVGTTTL